MTKFERGGSLTGDRIADINLEMAARPIAIESATYLIDLAADTFGGELTADTSFGEQSALMWDGIDRTGRDITFTYGDPLLAPPQTYQQRDALTTMYPMDLQIATPDPADFADIVEQKLWRSQRRVDKDRFLEVVKLQPLRKLDHRLGKRATLSAARAEQTLDREGLDFVVQQHDGTYRIYPFLEWTEEDVDRHIDQHALPRNTFSRINGMGGVSLRNVVYYDGAVEIIDFDSCGRNSPDDQPVHI